jgi:hypothetical protein
VLKICLESNKINNKTENGSNEIGLSNIGSKNEMINAKIIILEDLFLTNIVNTFNNNKDNIVRLIIPNR